MRGIDVWVKIEDLKDAQEVMAVLAILRNALKEYKVSFHFAGGPAPLIKTIEKKAKEARK